MKNYQQKPVEEEKDLKLRAPSVTKYMTRDLITFTVDTEISEVIRTLLENRITGAPVLNERGEVVGLIDDKDCLKILVSAAYYNHPVAKDTVGNYMSNVMKSISSHDNIVDVANIFLQTPYKRLLVKDDKGKLVGQVSRRDILRAIQELNISTW